MYNGEKKRQKDDDASPPPKKRPKILDCYPPIEIMDESTNERHMKVLKLKLDDESLSSTTPLLSRKF